MIRSQTVLVLFLIVVVIQWGTRPAVSSETTGAAPTPEGTAIASRPEPTPTAAPTVAPTDPPRPTPTVEPTATIAPTPEPTEIPVPTERPDPPETGQQQALVVERGQSGRLEVAFTFDAGEGVGYTVEILDLLAEYGIPGTFGVTGEWAEQNPEVMQRIVDDGHQLLNHTYDHSSFTGNSTGAAALGDDERRSQIERTEAAIAAVTGGYETSPYFRFPYGDYDAAALDLLGEMGFAYTLWWSCDTQGWNGFTPDEIVAMCGTDAEKGGPGAILLMHVANENDWNALEPLVEDYLAAGYDAVTIEQLLQP